MSIHPKLALAITAVGLFTCVGCQSLTSSTAKGATTKPEPTEQTPPPTHRGPEVEVVRSGVLGRYDSTTVGKAFEGTFQNAKWSSFETPKGATVVQFDGTVTADALKKAGLPWDAYYDAKVAPVVKTILGRQ
jgi:hypothetical protein